MHATDDAPRSRNAHDCDDIDCTNSNSDFETFDNEPDLLLPTPIASSRISMPTAISAVAKVSSFCVKCESPTATTVSSYSWNIST